MPERTTTSRRRRRLVRGASAFLVLIALGGYAVTHYEADRQREPHCLVRGADPAEGAYRLRLDRMANAATIAAVGTSRGLPERAVTIAVATAMQESSLRNLDHGHLDSLGLFQQRPSMEWGTEEQIMDPVYASSAFYEKLAEITDYQELPLTVAAQEVQRSAHPGEYAKHEIHATLLSGALTGRVPASLECVTSNDPTAGDPAELTERLAADFVGRATVEELPDGPTELLVTLADPPGVASEEDGADTGWALAHWLLSQAEGLGVASVSWNGLRWESARSDEGWREVADDEAAGAEDSANAGDTTENSGASMRISLFPGPG
ncbi:hypothetical protein RM844_03995 [Streptomyces sp. DSM 44915]|uniref:ARB-07466-like C-terminal domain-containing protein n=1 Tax=Streptomyces chisholmiae TaxID=3075540 RepID=A0ABU2JKD7_9ACTN|nr:hypothetical protein [Streptomyces sp. DSM 44915]MDT0265452.1 hypothetical protein [Streptomyces sp. DSM 44915]